VKGFLRSTMGDDVCVVPTLSFIISADDMACTHPTVTQHTLVVAGPCCPLTATTCSCRRHVTLTITCILRLPPSPHLSPCVFVCMCADMKTRTMTLRLHHRGNTGCWNGTTWPRCPTPHPAPNPRHPARMASSVRYALDRAVLAMPPVHTP
jgi:hypothetical protein